VFTLHGLEDLLKGRHIGPVAGEDFVGKRKTFSIWADSRSVTIKPGVT
jgi:hypothetical protein